MIELIGKKNCGRCNIVKDILNSKNIEYNYSLLEDFSQLEQDNFINMATNSGQTQMPLIIKNNKIITLQEV